MDTPPLFVVTGRFLQPAEIVAEATPRHREWLDHQYRAGTLLLSGRQLGGQGGILLARASSQASLEALLATDPMVIEGVAAYTCQGFTPTKRAEGIEIAGIPLVK
ncbi:YciI family protein [Deinococcus ruber]|uniref:YCII-related domain-containing protein n=1 Tax=Deinococcus ruber TaxID=1848197 RepID=A0A918F9Y1_9DEIO|nr:YciI family protein [Deinococcus ruber]GGR23037.1 hypothetical protein GCM10008957_38700 [Deinococcus ruber]